MSQQHVILCEGYDDRAFWAGWLLHLGCTDLSVRPDSGRSKRILDPWGRVVSGGQFGFATTRGAFVRLVPCDGGGNVAATAAQFFKQHVTHPIGRLLVNLDADDTLDAASTSAHDIIAGIKRTNETPIEVCPVIWTCDDETAPGLPAKQTLERLVAAAIVAAHPRRGPSVATWLDAEPRGGATHKHHALSYLAKWYAEHGPDDFFKALWRDAATASQLEARLRRSGAWAQVEALAQA